MSGSDNANTYAIGDDIYVRMKIENLSSMDATVRLSLSIRTSSETALILCDTKLKGKSYVIPASSEINVVCRIYSPPINYGDYLINIAIFDGW